MAEKDHKIFNVGFVVIDTTDDSYIMARGTMMTYICPHCSKTHFELTLPEAATKITTALDPRKAEAIGKGFICPDAADPDDMGAIRLKPRH